MRIVHLSDYHVDKDSAIESKSITDKLIDSLVQINEDHKIDLIICSGDLVNKGGQSYKKIGIAFKAFEMILVDVLLSKLAMPKKHFIFTIGNHDIDRDADNKYIEIGLQSELSSVDKVNEFYDSNDINGIRRVLPFKQFENKFYSGSFDKDFYYQSNFESCYILDIGDKKIGIACLNSVWRCYDSKKDKGVILLAERQIHRCVDFLSDCDIKIAISHHHYDWIADFEKTVIANLLNTNFDIYMCGHTHSSEAELCIKPSGKMFTFVAPGILSKNKFCSQIEYKNGFSVIDYNLDCGKAISKFYIQEFSSNFKLNTSVGNKGVWEVDIPLGDDALRRIKMQQIILEIKDEIAFLNKHLLSYNTSSNAPKSLNEIFVMPDIVKCCYNSEEGLDDNLNDSFSDQDSEVQLESLSDLIVQKDNVVVFGIKESGKTVLLDKILYDILNAKGELLCIPVLFDFSRIKNGIKKNIQEYWKKTKFEVDEILDKSKILLLIDDMRFEPESQEELTLLNQFVEQYKNVRFIGTSLNLHEHDVMLDPNMTFSSKFVRYELK